MTDIKILQIFPSVTHHSPLKSHCQPPLEIQEVKGMSNHNLADGNKTDFGSMQIPIRGYYKKNRPHRSIGGADLKVAKRPRGRLLNNTLPKNGCCSVSCSVFRPKLLPKKLVWIICMENHITCKSFCEIYI